MSFLFGEGGKNWCVFLRCIIYMLIEHFHQTIQLLFKLAGTLAILGGEGGVDLGFGLFFFPA